MVVNFAGEIFELKAELNSDKKDRKKEAVKKVIASMTVGKDVRYKNYLLLLFLKFGKVTILLTMLA